MSLVCLSSANCLRAFLCIIFRRVFLLGRQPCRPIWCSVRRMVWAVTGWFPTTSTSATMLVALIHLHKGSLGRGGIHKTSTGHWGYSGTPPLLHIHYITGSHHTVTWFLIPLLWWWYTALSLISTRWSNGSCTDLRLPGGHLCMDERTSPTVQPGKDWASCLPCHSNSTAWALSPSS